MLEYNPRRPLIVIHIPKAGGISTKVVFEQWYGDGLLDHYYDQQRGRMPPRRDLAALHSAARPVVLHGHFNRLRGFGVEDYYPEANQFVTILRDPYELTISLYHHARREGHAWKDKSRIPRESLEEYLRKAKPNMLNHFPREVTLANYKDLIEEFFIAIGITERLGDSMAWIARKLGKTYDPSMLEHRNRGDGKQRPADDLREIFMENNPLEFAVYHYALERFNRTDG
jgi:hypothetical protein